MSSLPKSDWNFLGGVVTAAQLVHSIKSREEIARGSLLQLYYNNK